MTALTVQDGKLVLRDGKLGSGQGCCCQECDCAPCGDPALYIDGEWMMPPQGATGSGMPEFRNYIAYDPDNCAGTQYITGRADLFTFEFYGSGRWIEFPPAPSCEVVIYFGLTPLIQYSEYVGNFSSYLYFKTRWSRCSTSGTNGRYPLSLVSSAFLYGDGSGWDFYGCNTRHPINPSVDWSQVQLELGCDGWPKRSCCYPQNPFGLQCDDYISQMACAQRNGGQGGEFRDGVLCYEQECNPLP